jgi:hypothetical protein
LDAEAKTTTLDTIGLSEANFKDLYTQAVPSTTYLTHGIHAYTARLIPQIPRFFIEKYTTIGDIVFDPFCGSGTTCIEASILGRRSVGMDINPLAILISKAKTTRLSVNEITEAISTVIKGLEKNIDQKPYSFPKINYWFTSECQIELSRIKSTIDHVTPCLSEKQLIFVLACFSSIIRKSSLADHGMAKTYRSKRLKKRFDNGWKPNPLQYFKETLNKNGERLKELSNILTTYDPGVELIEGDATRAEELLTYRRLNGVDLVVTSPPYINAQDYFRSYKLELFWLGLSTEEQLRELNRLVIGTEQPRVINYNLPPDSLSPALDEVLIVIWNCNKKNNRKKAYIIFDYFRRMDIVFQNLSNCVRQQGILCMVTGNNTICQQTIPTYKILADLANRHNFELIEMYRDEIANRWLFPGRNHECGTIKEEWITVFRKH